MTLQEKVDASKKSKSEISSLLKPYQEKIEGIICREFPPSNHSKLHEACAYALLNGGRRFRPALVFMVAEALGRDIDVSLAALAIEYFHTASLIADDLPCMDNDDERRNKPSLHIAFGETTALLSSYALIAAGNHCIAACAQEMKRTSKASGIDNHLVGILALDNAAGNTGLLGTTGGQFLDIFPPDISLSTVREVIQKKTVSLFEVAFVFGWLFGGGDPGMIEEVKKTASHFGMAFQIADDLGDYEQDLNNGRKINVATIFGIPEAVRMFHEEIKGYRNSLGKLHINSKKLLSLASCLEDLVIQ